MARPKWCYICSRNVFPDKRFSVIAFLAFLVVPYLLYYTFLKRKSCPVCHRRKFGPARKTVVEVGEATKRWR